MSEKVELMERQSNKLLSRTGSVCRPDPQDLVVKALEDRDLPGFLFALQEPTIDLDHWYPERRLGTLLDIAVRIPSGSDYVQELLAAGANPNLVNRVRKKSALHWAAELGHGDSVRALLAHPETNPNLLDSSGNTVLHLAAKSLDPDILEAVLNHPKIEVNLVNRKGQTPIHVAVLECNKGAVERLLKVPNIQLDTTKNHLGKTGREVVLQAYPELEHLLDKVPVSSAEGDSRESCTPASLFALARGRDTDGFIKMLRVNQELVEAQDGLYTILQYSAEQGLVEEVRCLLDLGADPNRVSDSFNSTPVVLASGKGYIDIVRLLVDHDKIKVGSETLHAVVRGASEDAPLTEPSQRVRVNHLKVLKLLLKQVPTLDVNLADVKGCTPLHLAAKSGLLPMARLLLQHGAYLGALDRLGEPAMADIPPTTLEELLNQSIYSNDKLTREDNYQIIFNYSLLIPPNKSYQESQPLVYMSGSKEFRHLLKHPLITSFLHLKWHKMSKFFYLNLAFYTLFWLLLTVYILTVFGADPPTENDDSSTSSSAPIWGLVSLLLCVLVIREFFQLIVSPLRYITNPENWLEVAIIGVTGAMLWCDSCRTLRHQVSAIGILLSWAELVLLIGRHPALSTNIEMLKTVSWNFLTFLAWYSILIVAFALSFYTLFRDAKDVEDNFFEEPGTAVFKTVVMLTGEFDAAAIPFVQHPVTSHILFVLFVFLIAIVLFNLLNGLAVSDTAAIKSDAELLSYISRVKLVAYVETMAIRPNPCWGQSRLCCVPPSFSEFSPIAFSQQINLFSDELIREARVLPNLGNRVVWSEPKKSYYDLELGQECREECQTIRMEPGSVKAAIGILTDRQKPLDSEVTSRKVLEELALCKQALAVLSNQNQVTSKLLSAIASRLSLDLPTC